MLTFIDLIFEKNKETNTVVVTLYNLFYFEIPFNELDVLGSWQLQKNSIAVKGLEDNKLRTKFLFLLEKYMKQLKSKLNGNPVMYLHQNSGIPLIGLQFIGIVDKGSEMIEVRPITNCNMNCIFCSVDEGPDSRKQIDFVVEKDYLVQELKKLLEFKYKQEENKANIWINPSGEPFLYAPLAELVGDINAMPQVKEIHIITNGVLLNKPIIDQLSKCNKGELNVSISGFSSEKGKQMMGSKAYSIERVLEEMQYAAKKMKVTVTPVYVKGYNEEEMKDILIFCKKHNIKIQIQKFTTNKFGRNPIKEQSWEQFFAELQRLQDQTAVPLIQELGKIEKTNEYPKPFKKGDVIEVEIKALGRMKNDKIAVAKQRAVLVLNCPKEHGKVKIRLVQSKHGLYMGVLI
ncbi:radical SAM protein [Candidatus Woesearchaeota archaeon]|nr:radical SAM protein [Candidatus Woesearchaeota archaeon]